MPLVTVRLLDIPLQADRDYGYLLPDALADEAAVGRIALVPFGQGNKGAYAVITAKEQKADGERKYKTVLSLLPSEYRVTEEILKLCFFLSSHTLCSVGEAVRAAMPSAAFGQLREVYYAKDLPPTAALKPSELGCLAYLSAHGGVSADALEERFLRVIPSLMRQGLVIRRTEKKKDASPKTERVFRVSGEGEEALLPLKTPGVFANEKQKAVYLFLLDTGEVTEEEIKTRLNVSSSPLHALVKKGVVKAVERQVERNPYRILAKKRDLSPVVLSRAQTAAYEQLSLLANKEEAGCALLYGVTGSGKTKVMIRLLDDVLASGKQAILMVPEIALTPQTVGIFCSRYGERVSVLHSSLSVGERFDAYQKILSGGADLVIGTRSAVFAPLQRLGLILIDEEHEHTYKSDAAPRYHTRDVAAYRSAVHGALTVLASATPSIESYYKAQKGKYTLVPLLERYGGASLPVTEIVDMRAELRKGNTSPLSQRMAEALSDTVADGKQAILFLNRRGFHPSVTCKSCGEPLLCPHCSVSLTYHSGYTGGFMLCHACGAKSDVPKLCPSCGSEHLSYLGIGTQKAEAALADLLGGSRVLRMDADTTGAKAAYHRILGKFRDRQADVLLGTQMVTKGHDFPAVALSGVLLADSSLYMNDFRAAERTFSLLTQVIGRAGRAGEGIAIIQTFSPDNKVIRLAAAQDYPAFYEEEIAFRRAMRYPPFCDIGEIYLSAVDEQLLLRGAAAARDRLIGMFRQKAGDLPAEIYGPLEPQAYKVAERYRMKLLVKCRLTPRLRLLFAGFLTEFSAENPKITVSVDFNPTAT